MFSINTNNTNNTNNFTTNTNTNTNTINWTLSKARAFALALERSQELSEEDFENEYEENEVIDNLSFFDFDYHMPTVNTVETKFIINSIVEGHRNEQYGCAEIRKKLFDANRQLPTYKFDLCLVSFNYGIIECQQINSNSITFILTCQTNDQKRCRFIRQCIEADLETDDFVYVVMAERDYNLEYLETIGLNNLQLKPNKLCIAVIPNGLKTAGYTRSWCVYLSSVLQVPDTVNIWIRDDRRKVVAIKNGKKSSSIDNKKTIRQLKNRLELVHGTIYSPNSGMIWKHLTSSRNRENVWETGKWSGLAQVLCATKKTWRMIQNITVYPQGPIFEDYYFSQILFEAGFKCSTMGKKIGIHTLGGLKSIARPGDTENEVIKCPYKTIEHIDKAIEMAKGIIPSIKKYNIDDGYYSFTLSVGENSISENCDTKSNKKKNNNFFPFSNKPGAQGGGQTHTIVMMWMLQQMMEERQIMKEKERQIMEEIERQIFEEIERQIFEGKKRKRYVYEENQDKVANGMVRKRMRYDAYSNSYWFENDQY